MSVGEGGCRLVPGRFPSAGRAVAEAEHSPTIKTTRTCSCSSLNQKLVFGNKQRFVLSPRLLTSDSFRPKWLVCLFFFPFFKEKKYQTNKNNPILISMNVKKNEFSPLSPLSFSSACESQGGYFGRVPVQLMGEVNLISPGPGGNKTSVGFAGQGGTGGDLLFHGVPK